MVKEELEQLKSIYNFGSQFLFKEEGPLQFVLSKPYLWLPSNILQLGYVDCDRKSNVVQSKDNLLDCLSFKNRMLLNYIGCNDWNIQLDSKNWFNKWKPPPGAKRCTVGAASFVLTGNTIKYHIPIYLMDEEWGLNELATPSEPKEAENAARNLIEPTINFGNIIDDKPNSLDKVCDNDQNMICDEEMAVRNYDEMLCDEEMVDEDDKNCDITTNHKHNIPDEDCLCSDTTSLYSCGTFELTQLS